MRRVLLFLILLLSCVQLSAFVPEPYTGHRQVETDRFIIIHEPQDEWAAQAVATFADDVLAQLSELLDHNPKRKIPVIITSRPAHANGYYSPIPPKIVMYITSSEGRFMGSRTADWLKSLFTHELTHYVHLTSPVGPAKYLTPVFGPAVPAMNTLLMPGWWVEGITTYTESTMAEGGRGDAPRFALTYEAPIAEGSMWPLSKGVYGSQFPPSGRIYSTGYLMVDHMMRTYGEDSFANINRSFAAWPFFGICGPVKRTIGKSSQELYREAVDAVSETLHGNELHATQYAARVIGDMYLPFTTAGGIIGFGRTHETNGAIFLHEGDGHSTPLLGNLPISSSHPLALTADGQTAYLSFAWADPFDRSSTEMAAMGYADLYRLDMVTGSFTRLTTKQRLMQPAVSPHGDKLVAIEPVGTGYRLLKVDIDTMDTTVLHEPPGGIVLEPSFSPDGSTIVAVEILDGHSTLVLVGPEDQVRHLWSHDLPELYNPRFVSKHKIWFASDQGGRMALFEHDLESGDTRRILSDRIGILGAIPYEEWVIYSTYTSDGHTLKELPIAALTDEPVKFGTTGFRVRTTESGLDNQTKRYRDLPRFNLWLPLPLETDNLLSPGASVLLQSLLGRHSVGISAAWDIAASLPFASVFHNYRGGPLSVVTQGSLNNLDVNKDRYHAISSQISFPLYQRVEIEGSRMIMGSAALAANVWETETAGTVFGYIGYGYTSPTSPKDYFGRFRYSALASLQHNRYVISGVSETIPIVSLTAQVPLWGTHHALALEIDAAYVGPGYTKNILVPDVLNHLQNKHGEAKALITARYKIPFSPLDQPIPFGGILGAGISLHAQSALYLDQGAVHWEEDVYVGATITTGIAIGGAFTLQPFASFAVSTATGEWGYAAGIGVETLFTGIRARDPLPLSAN